MCAPSPHSPYPGRLQQLITIINITSSSARGQCVELKGFQPLSEPRRGGGGLWGKMVLNYGISGFFLFTFFFPLF